MLLFRYKLIYIEKKAYLVPTGVRAAALPDARCEIITLALWPKVYNSTLLLQVRLRPPPTATYVFLTIGHFQRVGLYQEQSARVVRWMGSDGG